MTAPRRRHWPRLRLLALAIALLVGLLGFGLFPQEPLRRWTENRLRAALGPQVHVGRLHVVPVLLRAEAWDVRVATPTLAATLPRVRAHLEPGTLLGHGLALALLELDRPALSVHADPAATPAGSAWSGPLRIAVLRLHDGRVDYDGGARGHLQLDGVHAAGQIGGTLEVSASGGRVTHAALAQPLTLGPAHLALRITPELELHVTRLQAESGGSQLEVSGALGRVADWRLALDVGGHVELADVARVTGGAPLAGRVAVQGRVEGPPAALHAEATLTGAALDAAGWPIDRAELHVTHDAAGPGETRARLEAALLGGHARAEATLIGDRADARVTLADLDARALAPDAGVERGRFTAAVRARGALGGLLALEAQADARGRAAHGDMTLRTRARGDFDAATRRAALDWTLDAQAAGDGASTLREAELHASGRASGARLSRVAGRVEGRLRVAGAAQADGPSRPIDVTLAGPVQIEGGRVSAHLDAQALDGRLSADVAVRGARIDELRMTGDGLRLDQAVAGLTGRATLELRAAGPAAQLDGTGRVEVGDATWNDVALGPLRADVRLERGRPHVEARAPHLQAGVVATLADGALRGRVTLDGTPLDPLGGLLGQPLTGALTAQAEIDLPLDAPAQARVDAQVSALELGRAPWSARATRAFDVRRENGRTSIRGLTLEGSGAQLDLEATIGAPGEPLDVRAQAVADLAQMPLGEGTRAAGRLRADVRASGTLSRPRAEGWIDTRGVTAAPPASPETRLPEIALDDTRLELQGDALALHALRMRATEATLDVDGRLPWAALYAAARRDPARLDEDEQARLTLDWQGFDLRRWLAALAPRAADALDATLAGRAELRGGLLAPGEIGGLITLPKTALRVADVPLTLAPATLRLGAGRLETDALRLAGRDSALTLNGALDWPGRTLDLHGQGGLDLRLLSPFLAGAAVTGQAELDAEVTGPFARPRMLGTLLLHGGTLRLRELRQPLTEISAWITLDGNRLDLRELSARLGGGAVSGSGSARLAGAGLDGVDVRLEGDDVGLLYPLGLRSRLDADLRLAGRTGALRLGGKVTLERGFYDLDVVAERSLFAAVARPAPSPLMRSVALDLAIDIANPVVVRNNLADLRAGGRLQLRGDMETPAPFGRLTLVPGGTARLAGNDFILESGSLSYSGTWNPAIDLRAVGAKRIEDKADPDAPLSHDVTVTASGTLDEPRLALQATPPLDERQITSLLLTGRSDADVARQGGLAAGEQTAALLTGRLARGLSEGLRPLGIDQVTIEPQLVARDTDPGARFTFGKQLAPRAFLVYSTSLKSAEDRFVRLDFGPFYTLRVAGQRNTDGTRVFDLGQRLQWGGGPRTAAAAPRPDERVAITALRFEGDEPLPPDELRDAFGIDSGQRRTRWELIDRAETLRGRLVREGFLEAEVGARLEAGTVLVHVRSGPRYDWRVEGFQGAPELRGVVHSALFEEEALQNGRARLLRALHARGHLRAEVRARVKTRPGARTLVFAVEPGPRLEVDSVRFPGAETLSREDLLRLAGGPAGILADPQAAVRAWTAAYRERHFLAARVEPPRIEERGGRLTIEARIEEGPHARVAALRFEGATRDVSELQRAAGLAAGAPYTDAHAQGAAQRLRDHYLGLGHPEVRVLAEARPDGTDMAVAFRITEGPRVRIARVEVEGAHMTRADLLRGRAGLEPGAPLDLRELGVAEGRLRALGTLGAARVAIDRDDPGRLRIEVEELRRFAVGYNYRYDDERGGSVQVDAELRHLFGRGLVLGGRYQEGRDDREARAFLNLPLRPGPLTFSASRLSEDLPGIGDVVNNRVQRELRVQQVFERRPWLLLGGYRFKRLTLAPFVPDPIDVAALSLALLRDTRDNPLDARSGRFYGVDVELSPGWLAADLRFVKGFAQAFFTRSRGPFTWAQGYRLGLAASLTDDPITSSERFKAGGANSVRGFPTDSLGPLGVDDKPAGGEAVLVLNQELRWRHPSGLGAVVFYDAGNVFAGVSDLGFGLRHTLGAGLRYASPLGLLRVDMGFPLARREGERRQRIYFSLGQAF
jgi:outer membrane protein assembly factor BamA/autotransporter translocation and assembly factor TamB